MLRKVTLALVAAASLRTAMYQEGNRILLAGFEIPRFDDVTFNALIVPTLEVEELALPHGHAGQFVGIECGQLRFTGILVVAREQVHRCGCGVPGRSHSRIYVPLDPGTR